jgi:hypothetical protein
MSITMQIFLGSVLLGLCSTIHLGILVATVKSLHKLRFYLKRSAINAHWIFAMGVAFAGVVLAHTIQVWIWAGSFVALGALPEIADALYFSLVTYTTVGYGDVTVDHSFRIFAAMASVTGLLNFGLSTAFLVGLFTKLFDLDID